MSITMKDVNAVIAVKDLRLMKHRFIAIIHKFLTASPNLKRGIMLTGLTTLWETTVWKE